MMVAGGQRPPDEVSLRGKGWVLAMDDVTLFQMALGLAEPWFVLECQLDTAAGRLDLWLDFRSGARFACPECARADCPVHDSAAKQWRHLNFFQHECYLHAPVPRCRCERCGVRQVGVPWARAGSGFTLLFEAFAMALVRRMGVAPAAQTLGEHDTRLWRLVHHYVDQAREERQDKEVRRVGVDETSLRKGHAYISVFADLERRRVLFATPGKDAETVAAFAGDLRAHGGDAALVEEVCCDLSPAFLKGLSEHLPGSQQTYDKYHLVALANQALEEVRRAEQREVSALKNTRWLWLTNWKNLSLQRQMQLTSVLSSGRAPKTARAYVLKLAFQRIFELAEPADAAAALRAWHWRATHSRLEPMVKLARTIRAHEQGVLRYFTSRISNGVMEGINGLIQLAKSRARGFRTTRNMIAMVYLTAGQLDLALPT